MITRAFTPNELPSLIEVVFSSKDVNDTIRCLCANDAQTFIDMIDEVCPMVSRREIRLIEPTSACSVYQELLDMPNLSPLIRKKCLKSLYRMCSHHSLIPRALRIPICYDRNDHPLYKGGCVDVWKGEHCGQDVAVKVLRIYSTSDIRNVVDVSSGLCFVSMHRPAN